MAITADVLDDFDRPNESPLSQGGNWLNFSGLECRVVSNECAAVVGVGIAGYVGLTLGTVQECWAEFGSWALFINDAVYVVARATITASPNRWSGYAMLWGYNGITQTIQLRRIVNNAETVLATLSPFSMTAGDRLAVRTDGDLITGWTYSGGVWSERLSAVDATITSGRVGLSVVGADPRITAFGGGIPFAPQIIRTY